MTCFVFKFAWCVFVCLFYFLFCFGLVCFWCFCFSNRVVYGLKSIGFCFCFARGFLFFRFECLCFIFLEQCRLLCLVFSFMCFFPTLLSTGAPAEHLQPDGHKRRLLHQQPLCEYLIFRRGLSPEFWERAVARAGRQTKQVTFWFLLPVGAVRLSVPGVKLLTRWRSITTCILTPFLAFSLIP